MAKKKSKSASTSQSFLDDVPSEFRERFREIVELTDDFCDRFLNDEYKAVCRKMAASLCQEGSPVIRHAPREAQEVAFEQGLIPYIPADRGELG